MRVLLIIVIIWNVIDALGILISTFTDNESMSFAVLGSAVDNAIWPVSIAVLGTAVLQVYPYKKKAA